MDRRSFLATGATVALLPLTEAPAIAAVVTRTQYHTGGQSRSGSPQFDHFSLLVHCVEDRIPP